MKVEVRNRREIDARMTLVNEQSQSIRRSAVKKIEKIVEKKKTRSATKFVHGSVYPSITQRYVLSDTNETLAAVSVAKTDQVILRQKYASLMD